MQESQGVGGTPFSVLMEQAVSIRKARDAKDRTWYDSLPEFLRVTIFPPGQIVTEARQMDFKNRLLAATTIKEGGNSAFRDGRFEEARAAYGSAAAIFRYLKNVHPEWRGARGIRDEDMVEVDSTAVEDANSLLEQEQGRLTSRFLVTVYCNLALASIHLKRYGEASKTCDEALRLNHTCVKALYLRARAMTEPRNAGKSEDLKALEDLALAHRLEPRNMSVKNLIGCIRGASSKQRAKDMKMFRGVFSRGTLYHDMEIPKESAECKDKDAPICIAEADHMARHLSDRGMEREANDVYARIEKAKSRMSPDGDVREEINFQNPSLAMEEEARKHGIDLSDSQVLRELKRLQSKDRKRDCVNGTKPTEGAPQRSQSFLTPLRELAQNVLSLLLGAKTAKRHLWAGLFASFFLQIMKVICGT